MLYVLPLLFTLASTSNAPPKILTSKLPTSYLLDELKSALQPLVDAQAQKFDSGVVLSFKNSDFSVEVVSGSIQRTNEPEQRVPISKDDTLMWGSITKMYTAAQIMQLVEKGIIHLDDLAYMHVDPMLNRLNRSSMFQLFGESSQNITIRELLGMRSGIYDFDDDKTRNFCNNHPKFDVSPIDDLWFASINGGKKPLYPAGSHQDYSSTNFEILGLVLLHHTQGADWDQLDQRAVFGLPGSMLQKRFPRTSFAMHGPCSNFTDVNGKVVQQRVHGYEPDDSIGRNLDTYYMSCTNGYTCGNIAAPVDEINDFVWALYGPEHAIVSAESAAQMQTIWDWYGLGTMSLPSYRKGKQYCRVGHLGVTYGYTAAASYNPGFQFALSWGTGQEDPGQTATHGDVYDFLLYFDCVVVSKTIDILSNGTAPAVNCTDAAHGSFSCNYNDGRRNI